MDHFYVFVLPGIGVDSFAGEHYVRIGPEDLNDNRVRMSGYTMITDCLAVQQIGQVVYLRLGTQIGSKFMK